MQTIRESIILLNELFIEIDYKTIFQNQDISTILKDKMKYIKAATKYISLPQTYKLYKNITKTYEERSKDKYLEEIEYNMTIYFLYLLNTNIISEEEKIKLINNILFLYDKRLSNEEIISNIEEGKLKVYPFTDESSKYISKEREKILKEEEARCSLLLSLEEDINCIMKEYQIILEGDINNLNKTKIKKRIK